MEAGRELDALIAEKVMGWECTELFDKRWWRKPEVEPNESNTHVTDEDHFRPSSDIDAAWEVVEKLRKELCCFKLDSDHDYIWECYGTRDLDDHDHDEVAIVKWKIYAKADTAPLAICLAALKALGVSGD